MDSMKLKAISGTEKHLAITLILVSGGQKPRHHTLIAKNNSPGAPLGCSAEGTRPGEGPAGLEGLILGPEVRHGHLQPCEGPGLGLVSTAAHLALGTLKNRQTENKSENKMKNSLRWNFQSQV